MADTWTAIASNRLDQYGAGVRVDAQAVVVGQKLFVAAGYRTGSTYDSVLCTFDTQAQTYTNVQTNIGVTRARGGLAYWQGKLDLVWGASNGESPSPIVIRGASTVTAAFSSTNIASYGTPDPDRIQIGAAQFGSKLYAWGGYNSTQIDRGRHPHFVWWDQELRRFGHTSETPDIPMGHIFEGASVCVAAGRIWALGGKLRRTAATSTTLLQTTADWIVEHDPRIDHTRAFTLTSSQRARLFGIGKGYGNRIYFGSGWHIADAGECRDFWRLDVPFSELQSPGIASASGAFDESWDAVELYSGPVTTSPVTLTFTGAQTYSVGSSFGSHGYGNVMEDSMFYTLGTSQPWFKIKTRAFSGDFANLDAVSWFLEEKGGMTWTQVASMLVTRAIASHEIVGKALYVLGGHDQTITRKNDVYKYQIADEPGAGFEAGLRMTNRLEPDWEMRMKNSLLNYDEPSLLMRNNLTTAVGDSDLTMVNRLIATLSRDFRMRNHLGTPVVDSALIMKNSIGADIGDTTLIMKNSLYSEWQLSMVNDIAWDSIESSIVMKNSLSLAFEVSLLMANQLGSDVSASLIMKNDIKTSIEVDASLVMVNHILDQRALIQVLKERYEA